MPATPSPQDRIITGWWPTGVPMAFYVRVNMGQIPSSQIPSVGTTYGDTLGPVDKTNATGLLNYEFVIDVEDKESGIRQFHYAAPLMTSSGSPVTISGQESYNYEVFNTGEYEFPRCVQTWLIKRSAYDPDLLTTAPPSFAKPYTWTRTNSRQLRTATAFHQHHQLMDSLYVIYEVTWIDVSTILTSYDPDPETRDNVTITRQLTVTSGAPTQAAGSEITKTQVKPGLWLVTTRTIGTTPTGYTLNKPVEYTFPALLVGITLAKQLEQDPNNPSKGRYHCSVNPNLRSARRKLAAGKTVVAFSTTNPIPASLTTLATNDPAWRGIIPGFSFAMRDVINNAVTLTVALDSADYSLPGYSESVALAASSPSYTTYLGYIGTFKQIGEQVERWRFGLYRQAIISVTME